MADRSGRGAGSGRRWFGHRDQAPQIDRVVRHRRAGAKGLRRALFTGAAVLAAAVLVPDAKALFQEPPPPPESVVQFAQVLSGPPSRVRISAIGVDAPLVQLKLDKTGKLEAPKDFQTPGWYADGTPPGDAG